jgi:hypothetical protein
VTISSATPSSIVLDTGRSGIWQVGDSAFIASVAYNNTGTPYTIIAYVAAESVGGSTRARLELSLRDAATGVPVNWGSALSSEGHIIDIVLLGFLK